MTTHPQQSATVSEQLAREACEMRFDDLPALVVHEAKRRVLDTIGCAIGGSDSPPSTILKSVLADQAARGEATLIGTRLRTTAMEAALGNGVMVRFTEAMDRGFDSPEGALVHGHTSEIIPSILAVAEREHASGRDVIAAVVLGYQLLVRLSAAAGGAIAIEKLGWKNEIRAAFVVPLVVGRLMRLNEAQLVNAVGISGCFGNVLGIAQHDREPTTMTRNLRFPFIAHNAILATMMAKHGFEGPSRIFEGHDAFSQVIMKGDIDLDRIVERDDDYKIMHTWTKAYPIYGSMQPLAEAVLRVVQDNDILPERVAHVRIKTSPIVVQMAGDPATRRFPRTKETADHSAYFVAALAIVDRAIHFNFDQFTTERFDDPQLRSLIDKIELVAMSDWTDNIAPTEVEVTTLDGSTYRHRVNRPKGHMLNPLSDHELEVKFRELTSRLISETQLQEVLRQVYRLDEMDDVHELTNALAF